MSRARDTAGIFSLSRASYTNIYPLDDISNLFDGITTRFQPKYSASAWTITNPQRLFMYVNGIMQEVKDIDNVWLCDVQQPGYIIDNDGYISFSEAPQPGSTFDARVMPATDTNTKNAYPFKALNILLGV